MNPLTKLTAIAIRDACPELLKTCPYYGLLKLRFPLTQPCVKMLPPGTYLTVSRVYDDIDDLLAILSFTFAVEV